MKVIFVNPPNTTSLEHTEKGRYVKENIGNRYFILPRIPFEVTAILDHYGIQSDLLLLDYEWFKDPSMSNMELIDLIAKERPDIVMTTLIAQANTDSIDFLTTKIKEKLPNCRIIVGGQAITHLRDRIFKFCPNIDYAWIGESNHHLAGFINALKAGKKDLAMPGLLLRDKQGVKVNEIVKKQEVINLAPEQIYGKRTGLIKDIIEHCSTKNMFVLGLVELAKGCPFQCEFCAAKKTYVERDFGNTLNEIRYMFSMGIPKFYIIDLTFGINMGKTEDFLSEVSIFKKDYPEFGFRCYTRSDRVTKRFAEYLAKAGCQEVGIGVECSDDVVLENMNKIGTENKAANALNIIGNEGISCRLFLIEGYPGSSARSSRKTFCLLNDIGSKNHDFIIQPALSRDIIPTQERFKEREETGIIMRGTLNQLDFRQDCRKYGWDNERALRAMCYLILAYPSTEFGRGQRDVGLQEQAVSDSPFFNDPKSILNAIEILGSLPSDVDDKVLIRSLRADIAHYLDGAYELSEIKEKLLRLYGNKEIVDLEVDRCIQKLKDEGLVDSFGSPSISYAKEEKYKEKTAHPSRKKEIMLFYNGKENRYVYAPNKSEAIKVNTCFFRDLPKEFFEFLIFFKGYYSLGQISEKLYSLFKGDKNFSTLTEAESTVGSIYTACKKYGLCS